MRPLARSVLVLATTALFAVGAHAAGPDAAAVQKARAQFQQALGLETAGDYPAALALLREVGNVKMTPQVRFHIASCEEHVGRLVGALGDYQLALGDATDAKIADVAQESTERIEQLKARIPKVVLKRGAGAEFATISLDGVALGAAAIGTEIPIDPGPHSIDAKAPGYSPLQLSFSVAEKEKKTLEITLTKPGTAAASASAAPPPPPPPTATATEKPSPSVLPYVVGGVGVASLAASGVFFLLRQGAISDLDAACGPNKDQCPASTKSTYDSGKTYSLLAPITLGVGLVGVGVGTYLLLSGNKSEPATTTGMRVVPSAPGANAGASVVGAF